nr:MAG TPA: hypothetical protein [Caudoviricetes sp.]
MSYCRNCSVYLFTHIRKQINNKSYNILAK